jgi:hypothetical protein
MTRHVMPVVAVLVACVAAAEEPVALRVENLLVSPSHGPLVRVAIENRQKTEYRGVVRLLVPAGWRIAPSSRPVVLKPGQVERVAFNVEQGEYREANSYPVEAVAEGAGTTVRRRQSIACCSAPYFKPTIDGKFDEWNAAIPVSFTTRGKRTTISTYWNRAQFSMLVSVEEDRLVPYRTDGQPFDAIQISLSAAGRPAATSPDQDAGRYEFLIAATETATGKCFQLARPDTKLSEAAGGRDLSGLLYDKAQVSVVRQGGVTSYECGLPMKPMRAEIPPSEGREFCLSLIVHDPDGTGPRDWGAAAGLWPWQRRRQAWAPWPGAQWGDQPPYDNRLEWGMCASKF